MDTVEQTSIMLKEKSEDQNHAGFKNLKKISTFDGEVQFRKHGI